MQTRPFAASQSPWLHHQLFADFKEPTGVGAGSLVAVKLESVTFADVNARLKCLPRPQRARGLTCGLKQEEDQQGLQSTHRQCAPHPAAPEDTQTEGGKRRECTEEHVTLVKGSDESPVAISFSCGFFLLFFLSSRTCEGLRMEGGQLLLHSNLAFHNVGVRRSSRARCD